MPCPKATHGRHRARVNRLLAVPHTGEARHSHVLRQHLDHHGYVTPNFSWAEMADTGGAPVPKRLRPNAIRHCWNLERLKHELTVRRRHRHGPHAAPIAISIDGPYRTPAHNTAIGGARLSQHVQACASDHFKAQVERWLRETGITLTQLLALVDRIFANGGVGNENSGTLHLDSRGWRARFTTWAGDRFR